MHKKEIKVLVVDDSPFMRKVMATILRPAEHIRITGFAGNGAQALEMIKNERPDVITLDVEMPVMDGLETLRRIMEEENPVPCLMVSSLTTRGADITFEALEEGAVDFIIKPSSIIGLGMDFLKRELLEKIAAASNSHPSVKVKAARKRAIAVLPAIRKRNVDVVLIGISTGGPQALDEIIPQLPVDFPVAIAVAQHMPRGFTKSLAERLNARSNIKVEEAKEGDIIKAGRVLIGQAGIHLKFREKFGKKVAHLDRKPKDENHFPCADVMFESAAKEFGGNVMAVVMTGMGKDGTRGLTELKKHGAFSMAQSEKTCAVFGMPKSAIEAGVVDRVVDLGEMVTAIMEEI